MLERLWPASRIAAEWPAIRATIEGDPAYLWAVLDKLMLGHAQAWKVSGPADGYMVTTTMMIEGTNRPAIWVSHVAGTIRDPRAAMPLLLAELRAAIADWNTKPTEIRFSGRRAGQWQKLVPGAIRTGDSIRLVI